MEECNVSSSKSKWNKNNSSPKLQSKVAYQKYAIRSQENITCFKTKSKQIRITKSSWTQDVSKTRNEETIKFLTGTNKELNLSQLKNILQTIGITSNSTIKKIQQMLPTSDGIFLLSDLQQFLISTVNSENPTNFQLSLRPTIMATIMNRKLQLSPIRKIQRTDHTSHSIPVIKTANKTDIVNYASEESSSPDYDSEESSSYCYSEISESEIPYVKKPKKGTKYLPEFYDNLLL